MLKKIIIFFWILMIPAWCLAQTSKNLAPKAFKSEFRNTKNAVLLDVRTSAETFFGTIELEGETKEINYYNFDFEQQIQKLDKSKTYFVYCRTGIRSRKAIKLMQKHGFKKLVNLKGGYNAWTEIY